jgi:outer membrane lipoprotein carrier protein
MRTIIKNVLLVLTCQLSILTNLALAAELEQPIDLLNEYINSLESFQADFTQTIFGQSGQKIDLASGAVTLQKPGKFYWAYTSPYNQVLVSNGNILWVHDIDLEQVTINDMDLTHSSSPAAILSGNVDISHHHTVSDLGDIEGHRWIELLPIDTEQEFSALRLGFDESQLSGMVLFDNLGQTTVIQFKNISVNHDIPPGIFQFSLPEGVDVIDSRPMQAVD